MKCKNCNHKVERGSLIHSDNLYDEDVEVDYCKECDKNGDKCAFPEVDCKHLEDYNVIANVINEADGSISLCVCNDNGSHDTAISNVRFCPFCGDELK